jgi:hypothetical protein
VFNGAKIWFVVEGRLTPARGIGGFFIPAVNHIEDEPDEIESLEPMTVNVGNIEPVEGAAEPLSM